ncbi:hypothetical protein [Cupriavidus sp. YAF13]|uniref:hypothetical protein n=1 Tax=Cupriavidus sp. YAF13 TaxID=3233075 RepID=UPI003F901FB6
MTPHKQLISHDPEHGFWGDCWRTCIACLLDMAPAEVPNFAAGGDQEAADVACRAWLKARGYNLVKFCMLAEHAHAAADWFDDTLYILCGASPNIPGVAHCVIGRGAFEVVWDVARSGAGLAGPWEDEIGQRVYWVEFIVPLQQAALREAA